jgi:hypothetical protein
MTDLGIYRDRIDVPVNVNEPFDHPVIRIGSQSAPELVKVLRQGCSEIIRVHVILSTELGTDQKHFLGF